jgi:uncharacterized protein with PIN domain
MIGTPVSKARITELGQPCRKCGAAVVRHDRDLSKAATGKTYYAWWFSCPQCRTQYFVDEAKRSVTDGKLSGPVAPRVPVTAVGQPCRHCGTPVVKSQHKPGKPLKNKPGSYYFEFWFACPNKRCRTLYMVEAAKRWYDRPGEALDAFDVTPAESMVPKYSGEEPPWE